MSLLEIQHRGQTLLSHRLESLGLISSERTPKPDLQACTRHWITLSSNEPAEDYCRVADRIAQGRLDLFALHQANIGNPPQWNRDPLTGTQAPLQFGKTLNYRDPMLVGNIKYLWEPARHLQLIPLAQAYRLSGADHYLQTLATLLSSWLNQCPYGRGPHWCSSLELGIRLINWSLSWQLIGGLDSPLFQSAQGQRLRDRWLVSVYQHAFFIQSHLSRHSSANNHLIGEVAGLFIATTTWPFWPDFQQWQAQAVTLLEQEALRQNAPDGVNREQAVAYQLFVLEFLILALLAGEANDLSFSSTYRRRLERMLEYIASIMDVSGRLPMIGDADDGQVIRLSPDDEALPHSLLALGSVLFRRGDFKAKAGHFDCRNRWLLGTEGQKRFAALATTSHRFPIKQSFPYGGYYILGNDFETAREVRIVTDCGPLGYLNIAAHGHADALSFTLSAGGQELLIDPGTYSYHTQKVWRDYFRGTRAHNTICIDAQDQSQSGGNFMWLHKARAYCKYWHTDAEQDQLTAYHDGYTRLPNPVEHQRHLRYDKPSRTLHVLDQLQCNGHHQIELNWHFAEHCKVEQVGSGIVATCPGVRLSLRLTDTTVSPQLLRGCLTPPAGWVSRHFDVKEPTTTVRWPLAIKGATELRTEITIEFLATREERL